MFEFCVMDDVEFVFRLITTPTCKSSGTICQFEDPLSGVADRPYCDSGISYLWA